MDKFEDNPTTEELKEEYSGIIGIFPALHKYKADHNITNLKKLCVEIADFCRAIYASTENEQERQIFNSMLDKLKKQ